MFNIQNSKKKKKLSLVITQQILKSRCKEMFELLQFPTKKKSTLPHYMMYNKNIFKSNKKLTTSHFKTRDRVVWSFLVSLQSYITVLS